MSDPLLVPFRVTPVLSRKPWGGQRLRHLGQALAGDEAIGEAHATAPAATIADGPFAGQSLTQLVARDPAAVAGAQGLAVVGGQSLFPLLVKLIDARENLSIQVHPADDDGTPGLLGKTEMHHVLAAATGARIALGLRPDVSWEAFVRACREGSGTAHYLRWLDAVPGTSFLIPAGTVHALGAGCFIYEAQQPSDITYRLDDWNRRGSDGQPRPLHLDEGLRVIDRSSRPDPIAPVETHSPAGRRQLLAVCCYFAVERLALAKGERLPIVAAASAQTILCARGAVELTTAAGRTTLSTLEAGVLTAAAAGGAVRALAPAVVLRAWVPDADETRVLSR